MCEVWKQETYVRSLSFSSESAIKYLHVGRRKIQISPPPALPRENEISQMPYPRDNKDNQIPTLCPAPPPPRRLYIDRCIALKTNDIKHVLFAILTKKSVFWTVKACFTNIHLIQTPHYHRQFALSLGKETPTFTPYSIHLICSPVNMDLF